jgi:hypothetical protein
MPEFTEYANRGVALLFEHFGIDDLVRNKVIGPEDRYTVLAMALAMEHVPYFQPQVSGRKPDAVNELKLALAVEQEKRAGAKSDLAAIRRLQRTGKLKPGDPDDFGRKLRRARKDPLIQRCLRHAETMPGYGSDHWYNTLIWIARLFGQNQQGSRVRKVRRSVGVSRPQTAPGVAPAGTDQPRPVAIRLAQKLLGP